MINPHKGGDKEHTKKPHFSERAASAQSPQSVPGAVGTPEKNAAAQSSAQTHRVQFHPRVTLVVVGLLVLACYAIRSIIGPVKEIHRTTEELPGGESDARMADTSADKLEVLADGVRTMISGLRRYMKNITSVTDARFVENMTDSRNAEYRNEVVPIKESLDRMIASLNDTLLQINTAAPLPGTSERVGRNADSARTAGADIERAIAESGGGSGQIEKLTAAMDRIENTSGQLARMIQTIDDAAQEDSASAGEKRRGDR